MVEKANQQIQVEKLMVEKANQQIQEEKLMVEIANQQMRMQQDKYQKDIESRARDHEDMLAKVKREIEVTANKNFDTMAEDVRREAHENINKILLSHCKGKEEKGGAGASKQSYAKAATAIKLSNL